MPVEALNLGTDVCRALMSDLDDRPLAMEVVDPRTLARGFELTPAAQQMIALQWTAVLLPLPGMVSIRAHLKCWAWTPMFGGDWELAELAPGTTFPRNLFVPYPADRAAIKGPEFESELRAGAGKALAAVEADYARAHAEDTARKDAP